MGLEIALRGLRAQQQALNVTAHNVANASNPGYTRQEARLEATSALSAPGMAGQIGTGVSVQQVVRMRDAFLDEQLRNEMSSFSRYNALYMGLSEIETFFSEPHEHGLRTVLTKFWNSFQDVANDPESDAFRRTAIQSGEALADALRHARQQLSGLYSSLASKITERVSQVNQIAQQIADLNRQIASVAAARGDQPNDLRDKRDVLIDTLSSLAKVSVTEDETGQVRVTISQVALVSAHNARQVEVTETASGDFVFSIAGRELLQGADIGALGGEMGGMLELRRTIRDVYIQDLDQLASHIISSVNAAHRMGYGLGDAVHVERDFFSGTDAATIRVSADLVQNPSKLAASRTGLPGDGSGALEIARLKELTLMRGGTVSIDDFMLGMIGRLGVESQAAMRFRDNQTLLLNEIKAHKEMVQGVSLDEEMTNMVRFQHAYNACARLMTALDEMLDQLINRTGIAGR